ncbi:TPA: hypothetical protein IAA87_05745 [Candidatus Avigastranaerophilus faecigallinarum]|nr:hypothetical protein [Candidatus Avigastranaerophilus faecigallinarum]
MSDKINYSTNKEINGRAYFNSPAQSLADFVCKKEYDSYRFSNRKGFLNSEIFIEKILQKGSIYTPTKYDIKRNIGNLQYDLEKNIIIFQRRIEKPNKKEFKTDFDCLLYFSIQYEFYQYLRDFDLIEIYTIERKIRHKTNYKYTIKKCAADKNGLKKEIPGYGILFFIPRNDFHCLEIEHKRKVRK